MTRKLVKQKQLEFINGGWCMHDEASPYYTAMVDQTTRGHMFLKKNFGDDAIPKATWQIDPFGHSNTQAWLLGAEAGMQSVSASVDCFLLAGCTPFCPFCKPSICLHKRNTLLNHVLIAFFLSSQLP